MRFNKGLNNSHNDDETGSSTQPSPPHTFDSSSTTYFHEIYGKDFTDNNRLVIIDRLKVDEKSRLTLTKNAKHLLHIQPKDEVIMYHDVVNNHIILKIRRRGIGIGEAVLDDIVDSWILKRNAIVGYTFDRNHGKGSSKNNDIIVEKKYDSGFLGMRGDKSNNNSISDIQQYRQQQGEENIKKVPSINIMLIDDEKDILSAFKTALSSLGYNVEAFVNPQEALQHFLVVINTYKDSPKSYYKLVITDIRMEGLNGVQFYQILKALDKNIRILFISGLDTAEEITSILPGVTLNDIIRKPIEIDRLNQIVQNAIS